MNKISSEILKWNFKQFAPEEWEEKIVEELKKIPFVQMGRCSNFYTKENLVNSQISEIVFADNKIRKDSKVRSGLSVNQSSLEESNSYGQSYTQSGNTLVYLKMSLYEEEYHDFLSHIDDFNHKNTEYWFDFRGVDRDVIFQIINQQFIDTLETKNITGGILLEKSMLTGGFAIPLLNRNVDKFKLRNIHCPGLSIGEILALGTALVENDNSQILWNSLSDIQFTLDIEDNYFFEICRGRAIRFLWGKIAEIFLQTTAIPTVYLNGFILKNGIAPLEYHDVLAATTRSMSALMGGYDALIMSDAEIDETSPFKKAVENIPLILQEEAFFNNVSDAGKGSYYIEKETFVLAEEGWLQFCAIQQQGGYFKYIKDKNIE